MRRERKGRWFERHPAITVIAFVAALLVAVDLLGGWWLVPPAQQFFRRPHHYYHHDLVPNAAGALGWGDVTYTMFTNSLAFRDRRVRNVLLERAGPRIVLMGDSFTEGIGVRFEDTFAGRLEEALAPRGVEVLNAGVVGYSPRLYYLKTRFLIEERGLAFSELHVYLDMSDIPNEIIYETYAPKSRAIDRLAWELRQGMRRRSFAFYHLARLAAEPSQPLQANPHGVPYADDLDAAAFDDPSFYTPEGHWTEDYAYAERAFRLAETNMWRLARLCRAHRIAMTIVVYPWRTNIERQEHDHVQVRFWRTFARDHGVRFVDLFPAFMGEGQMYQRLFIEGDVHWNARGHALVARNLLSQLDWAAAGER
jgi:lysophospholipase L1-like esterase